MSGLRSSQPKERQQDVPANQEGKLRDQKAAAGNYGYPEADIDQATGRGGHGKATAIAKLCCLKRR